jgi:hypothetical protein
MALHGVNAPLDKHWMPSHLKHALPLLTPKQVLK